jgi:hypothetical protein
MGARSTDLYGVDDHMCLGSVGMGLVLQLPTTPPTTGPTISPTTAPTTHPTVSPTVAPTPVGQTMQSYLPPAYSGDLSWFCHEYRTRPTASLGHSNPHHDTGLSKLAAYASQPALICSNR